MMNSTGAHDDLTASAMPPSDPMFGIIEHSSEHDGDAGLGHGTQWSLAAAVEQREAAAQAARELLDTNMDGRVSIVEHARAALGSFDDRLEERAAAGDGAASAIASVVHRVVDRFDSDLFADQPAHSGHQEGAAAVSVSSGSVDGSDGELGAAVSDPDDQV